MCTVSENGQKSYECGGPEPENAHFPTFLPKITTTVIFQAHKRREHKKFIWKYLRQISDNCTRFRLRRQSMWKFGARVQFGVACAGVCERSPRKRFCKYHLIDEVFALHAQIHFQVTFCADFGGIFRKMRSSTSCGKIVKICHFGSGSTPLI